MGENARLISRDHGAVLTFLDITEIVGTLQLCILWRPLSSYIKEPNLLAYCSNIFYLYFSKTELLNGKRKLVESQ